METAGDEKSKSRLVWQLASSPGRRVERYLFRIIAVVCVTMMLASIVLLFEVDNLFILSLVVILAGAYGVGVFTRVPPLRVSMDHGALVDESFASRWTIPFRAIREIREYATVIEVTFAIGNTPRLWRLPRALLVSGDWEQFTATLKSRARAANPGILIFDPASGPPPPPGQD